MNFQAKIRISQTPMGFTSNLKAGSLSREPWLSLNGTSSSKLDHISSLKYF